ncbi:MAG: hypothetical protein HY897_25125 [Deltaproteobacteria bacterium]|nr:hypothetical protein [Deltaproteobacteria bacterium]
MISSVQRVAVEKMAGAGAPCGPGPATAFGLLLGRHRRDLEPPTELDPLRKVPSASGGGFRPESLAAANGGIPVVPHAVDVKNSIECSSPMPVAAAVEVLAVERAMDAVRSFGPVQCMRLDVGGGTVTVRAGACGSGLSVEVTTDSRVSPETRRAIVAAVRRRAPGAAVTERRRGGR